MSRSEKHVMNVAVFSTKDYDRRYLQPAATRHGHNMTFLEERLSEATTPLAFGFDAVCAFVNDRLSAAVIERLADQGVRLIALRSAGFNNVDLGAAGEHGIRVVRVPEYSPHAVAEHAVGLMLALNRKIPRAVARVRDGNFSLDGLLGFDLNDRTAGVVGTGKIGSVVVRILAGFGCKILAHDPFPSADVEALGASYVSLGHLFANSDIVTLHCPLVPETYHVVDRTATNQMKRGVMLINTSRGALLDTRAVIDALKSGKIGYLGLDVYEEEEDLFFEDLSDVVIQDDVFARLLTFSNVIVTGHQAFFTEEALRSIAETTMSNITQCELGEELTNEVSGERIKTVNQS
jgi:D-lactate dehydrogenase